MEGAPLPFSCLDLELTLMLVNDPVDRGEAQAGSVPRRLGCEEEFEDSVPNGRRDAGSGIGHGQAGKRARPTMRVTAQARLRKGHRNQPEGKGAPAGHGIAGVGGEIEDDLLHLTRIRMSNKGFEGGFDLDRHRFGECLPQQLPTLFEQRVEVKRLSLQGGLARKGQQLTDQTGGLTAQSRYPAEIRGPF